MVHLLEKALQYSIADRMLQFEEDVPPQSEVFDTDGVSSKEVTYNEAVNEDSIPVGVI